MKIHGIWRTTGELLRMLDDVQFVGLAEDEDAHMFTLSGMSVCVCFGFFCRSYQNYRKDHQLRPDPDHRPWEPDHHALLGEALRRGNGLPQVLRRIRRDYGDLSLADYLLPGDPRIEAAKREIACPRDTDGDGSCGMLACPDCGPYARIRRGWTATETSDPGASEGTIGES